MTFDIWNYKIRLPKAIMTNTAVTILLVKQIGLVQLKTPIFAVNSILT